MGFNQNYHALRQSWWVLYLSSMATAEVKHLLWYSSMVIETLSSVIFCCDASLNMKFARIMKE